jgi:hypothetical protein
VPPTSEDDSGGGLGDAAFVGVGVGVGVGALLILVVTIYICRKKGLKKKRLSGAPPQPMIPVPALAEVIGQNVQPDKPKVIVHKDATPPPYWSKVKDMNAQIWERCEVDKATRKAVQDIVQKTWAKKTTRDRGFAKVQKMKVVQVVRNENAFLWSEYDAKRKEIEKVCMRREDFVGYTVKTESLSGGDFDKDVLKKRMMNEHYLFHGTKPSATDSICEKAFNVNLAGGNKGTLYGPGVYLAESSSKADEYAEGDQDGPYKGLYAMLLCRAACGVCLYCDDVRPKVDYLISECVEHKRSHCVLGDREKVRDTYREFVIFDSTQIYPEYLVIYRHEDVEEEAKEELKGA